MSIRRADVFLYVIFTLYGFTALGVLPVFLELGVECTYPVDEATSSGIQWMFGYDKKIIECCHFFFACQIIEKIQRGFFLK